MAFTSAVAFQLISVGSEKVAAMLVDGKMFSNTFCASKKNAESVKPASKSCPRRVFSRFTVAKRLRVSLRPPKDSSPFAR